MTSSQNGNSATSATEIQSHLENELRAKFGEKLLDLPPHAWKEFGLTFGVLPENSFEVLSKLKSEPSLDFSMMVDITCVDLLDKREPRFDVVYHLLSVEKKHRLCIKVAVEEDVAEVDSVVSLWPGANFMEREVWDMYGVTFRNNSDMRRILMYEEFVGHPLRKDYPLRGKQPRVAMRVPELRNTSADMLRDELVALPTLPRTEQS